MKKAIVLGATGNMGSVLVEELTNRGIHTIAFARTEAKLKNLAKRISNKHLLTCSVGDAFNSESIVTATSGVDIIYHSVNLPYPEWEKKLIPLTSSVLAATKALNAKLVFINNIYSYGRSTTAKVTEEHPRLAHTKKGRIRLQMEQMISHAHLNGTTSFIVRLPDFYGPYAENTMLHFTLQAIATGKKARFIGGLDIPREFIYMPDAAKAVVDVSLHDHAYGQEWNIPGAGVITGREIIRIAEKAVGKQGISVGTIGKGILSLLGIFNRQMKEVVEMLYLTQTPVILSGAKYEREIGAVPATPYEQGITETVKILYGN